MTIKPPKLKRNLKTEENRKFWANIDEMIRHRKQRKMLNNLPREEKVDPEIEFLLNILYLNF